MNNSQVAHLWANKSKSSAKGSSFFFEGATIYSFGGHFPIATHVTNSKGEPAVIYTRDSYGTYTGRHKNLVSDALRGLDVPVFFGVTKGAGRWGGGTYLGTSKADLRDSFRQYVADAKKEAIAAKRARKYGSFHADRAAELLVKAAKLSAFFKLGLKVPAGELVTAEELAAMKVKEAAANKAHRDSETRRKAAQKAQDAQAFADWRNGTGYSAPYSYREDENGSAYLRIKGDEVQTSRGAQVPLEDARKVFRFVKACKEQGRLWRRNGSQVRIGHFNLDEVTPEGNVKAGCHFLTWERIAECAQAGAFFTDASSSEAVQEKAAA